MRSTRLGLGAVLIALAGTLAACGGGTTQLSLPITPDTACHVTSGKLLIHEVNGKAVATTSPNYRVHMTGGVRSFAWCINSIHQYQGTVHIALKDGRYVFRSSRNAPLRFIVRKDGFEYQSGKGSVVKPDGQTVNLP